MIFSYTIHISNQKNQLNCIFTLETVSNSNCGNHYKKYKCKAYSLQQHFNNNKNSIQKYNINLFFYNCVIEY